MSSIEVVNGCFVTEIENMQSNSSKGDSELQLMRKQLADEKLKKEQVRRLLLSSLVCRGYYSATSNSINIKNE